MRPLVWQAILQPAEMKVPATALQFDALGCRNQLRRFSLQQDVCYWMNHEAASAVSGDMGGRGVATINTAIEVRGGVPAVFPERVPVCHIHQSGRCGRRQV